jgi:hypothetical protein
MLLAHEAQMLLAWLCVTVLFWQKLTRISWVTVLWVILLSALLWATSMSQPVIVLP